MNRAVLWKRVVFVAAGAAGLYVGTYIPLSCAGSYRMGAVGLMGPKESDRWWPYGGINRQNEVRVPLMRFFGPLWLVDRAWFHKDTWRPSVPPFVQGTVRMVSPIAVQRPFKSHRERGRTVLVYSVVDARGEHFTIVRVMPDRFGSAQHGEYFVAPRGDFTKMIRIDDQATFRGRVTERFVEGDPSFGDGSSGDGRR